ncbi:hypothetical protein GUJ93_ZPchr0005g15937 [Zizania palustris]|uniref:RING/U-box superfamily protein n=1 Tax=Zizania palustris TaxID=103762 RepID=A0A8J5SRQ9_ZIZPA|nr:hypothetical protein GUJ93_ZPchr0005g15937 [Zizania palustris]
MDDSCVVCADALEWVAYGPCGHREGVFDLRRPPPLRDGGPALLHLQDPLPLRLHNKAQTRLRSKFRSIEQLKGHLFHQHRQHPGLYDYSYFHNYDDLELHFRKDHFLCEDETCLANKFVVFQNEAEFKRHNAMEHGGRMSRAQRNAALQIPTSFIYRRNEQDERRGREQQSRYAHILSQSSRGSARLGDESLFPPLPGCSNKGSASAQQGLQNLAKNTLASRLQQRSKGNVKVLHPTRPRPAENPELVPPVSSSTQMWPTPDQWQHQSSSSQLRIGSQPTKENGVMPSASNSACNPVGGAPNRMKHSVSTPNLVSGRSSVQASSSASYGNNIKQQPPQSSQTLPSVDDVRAANKTLVERIRSALGMDEDRYSAFKEIAGEYRQGIIDTSNYLSYVEQFGLSHLVPEMAGLLPDPQKQKDLADAYYTNIRFKSLQENSDGLTITAKEGNRKKRGKGKVPNVTETIAAKDVKDSLADSFLDTVRKLQLNKSQEGEAEVLSRDGYRSSRGKIQLLSEGSSSSTYVGADIASGATSKASGAKDAMGKEGCSNSINSNKQSKKTSKFLRARLGDNSLATFDLSRPNLSPERPERVPQGPQTGVPVRGVWKTGGGQKLFSSNGRK